MGELDSKEILRRIKELEQENIRLKNKINKDNQKQLIVTEGDYKGHPTLTFEGICRPFSLGLTKLKVLKQAWPQVESFLVRHGKDSSEDSTIEDDKI